MATRRALLKGTECGGGSMDSNAGGNRGIGAVGERRQWNAVRAVPANAPVMGVRKRSARPFCGGQHKTRWERQRRKEPKRRYVELVLRLAETDDVHRVHEEHDGVHVGRVLLPETACYSESVGSGSAVRCGERRWKKRGGQARGDSQRVASHAKKEPSKTEARTAAMVAASGKRRIC